MRMLAELIDLVLPADCLGCGRPGIAWCAACQPASVPRQVGHHPGAPAVFAAGNYLDQLRTALIEYKERGRRQLTARLADYLADAVDCAIRAEHGPAVLVPVPSRPAAARSRGGDHVLRLAHQVARQTGLPVFRALSLTGPVSDSAGLSAEQRRSNLAGRMAARAPAEPGLRPILLDDIVTTGATLAEAARALAAAGWPAAGAAVIAATALRRGGHIAGEANAGTTAPCGPEMGAVALQLGRSARKG